jgi:hypothetical protein
VSTQLTDAELSEDIELTDLGRNDRCYMAQLNELSMAISDDVANTTP